VAAATGHSGKNCLPAGKKQRQATVHNEYLQYCAGTALPAAAIFSSAGPCPPAETGDTLAEQAGFAVPHDNR